MKNVNRILIVVFFVIIIALLVAFTSIYPFTTVGYGWQCALCGFFGLLWIVCLLIEVRKKDVESHAKKGKH
jgi:membrane associated rhomboid family serine protease